MITIGSVVGSAGSRTFDPPNFRPAPVGLMIVSSIGDAAPRAGTDDPVRGAYETGAPERPGAAAGVAAADAAGATRAAGAAAVTAAA